MQKQTKIVNPANSKRTRTDCDANRKRDKAEVNIQINPLKSISKIHTRQMSLKGFSYAGSENKSRDTNR